MEVAMDGGVCGKESLRCTLSALFRSSNSLPRRRCHVAAWMGLMHYRCSIWFCSGISLARSRSTPARPYIVLFSVLSLLI